ncbi:MULTISPECIES: cob(I)yrinic acid a,c-diamide adenosyltransferase [unclassified Deinococcus]|uniref:cob(I)yrinic acid a,c-diamide adenosyltransferase n=1 Tax=unclassified Deinococcus TaxID=2623546 RepID=UPI0009934A32|nr:MULTISPECIES: cob(I)yrinic acid a,c-diamide adenosyltransferase [unclassified Deinococcus]MBX8464895.1 cob(I)yrinic acid a,c-diamide adenosyltransferase [Deinococcus sp. RIT780]MCD0164842.1 cob(I)yrinic acid a,c-diamide adenosyltransferase [Deinococcus sp. 12RED42]MCD0175014.1 cob(I)yrinic acid a,c-diamide adenosyltransferase [Deinococcus sp. 14RED07]OOV12859.1 cob(I)yrinic acid a,c-diamide adenosyltransferase [Deinococcus sp. LM3]
MEELAAARDAHRKAEGVSRGRRGLLIVNTGNGKGKTTAALGLMLRAHGRGLRVRMFQFLKHESAKFGEHRTLDVLGLPYEGLGDGFTWRSRDLENSAAMAAHGWSLARAAIESGEHDLIVLDEFTYALKYGWVPWPEVEVVLRARDPLLHVVVTGRDALPELIALADTVSEIRPVKHAYEAGIGAQTGIEY